MKITPSNWKQLSKGTKFYAVKGSKVTAHVFISDYEWNKKTIGHESDLTRSAESVLKTGSYSGFYAYWTSSVEQVTFFSLNKLGDLFTDYDEAKEVMWKNMVDKLRSTDKIFFDGAKLKEFRGLEMVLDLGIEGEK